MAARASPHPAARTTDASPDHHLANYWIRHRGTIQAALDHAVNATIEQQCADPVQAIGQLLLKAGQPLEDDGAESRAQTLLPPPQQQPAPTPESTATTTATPQRQQESWTVAKWLDALHINQTVAAQLASPDEAARSGGELAAMRRLVSESTDLRATLRARLEAGLDTLVDGLAHALRDLAARDEATPEQMQSKFLQDGARMLSFKGLSTFFGGLEAIVGAPDPKVGEAMAREHSAPGGDRHEEFITKNFGVTTTSATEWAFVVAPESRPANEWPVEGKLVVHVDQKSWEGVHVVASERQKQRRQPMPLTELKWRVAERGLRLQELGEPALTLDEAFGARLYTGPMFVKYLSLIHI